MTRPDLTLITTQPDPPEQHYGDCILHRTHHVFAGECWRAVITWNETHGWDADPDAYKAAYERALLNDLTSKETTMPEISDIEIPPQLADAGWNDTVNGIRLWELNEDGDLIITVGHLDRTEFAKACDDYARKSWDQGLAGDYEGGLDGMTDDVTHRWAQIIDPPNDQYFDFEVRFTEEGVGFPVTVWSGA